MGEQRLQPRAIATNAGPQGAESSRAIRRLIPERRNENERIGLIGAAELRSRPPPGTSRDPDSPFGYRVRPSSGASAERAHEAADRRPDDVAPDADVTATPVELRLAQPLDHLPARGHVLHLGQVVADKAERLKSSTGSAR